MIMNGTNTAARSQLIDELTAQTAVTRRELCKLVYEIHTMGHLGGGLSAAEVVTALHHHYLRYDPKNPKWEDRDRLVVSKGHVSLLMYVVLAGRGLFSIADVYREYNQKHGRFAQHANRLHVPGIEASAGSLGHGLSLALGMALYAKSKKASWRTICLAGDGEIQKLMWEPIMAAGHLGLGNLVLIVDNNGMQGSQFVDNSVGPRNLAGAIEAFGWDVMTIDGNDMAEVVDAFESFPAVNVEKPGRPFCIISKTTKGKGVSFMENNPKWHCNKISEDQLAAALKEIDEAAKVR